MKLSSFKYILTDIGGGWGTIHSFYGVTEDGSVYTTRKFDTPFKLDTEIECELLGKLSNIELGLHDIKQYAIMDGSYLTVYDAHDNFKVLHYCDAGTDSDPDLYKRIKELEYEVSQKNAEQSMGCVARVYIGEVRSAEEFASLRTLLSSGYPVLTTIHARQNDELVTRLREEMLSD